MATRSLIGYVTKEGTVRGTYCHFDGYPSGVGATLLEYYNTPDVVECLVQFEISSLEDGEGYPEYIENGAEGPYTWSGPVSFLNDFEKFGTEYHYLLQTDGDQHYWIVNAVYDSDFTGYAFHFLEDIVQVRVG
jgi:hypothetical protein